MAESMKAIMAAAERGDALRLKSDALIPIKDEARWVSRKLNPDEAYPAKGIERLISPRDGWTIIKGEGDEDAVSLGRAVAKYHDVFVGPQAKAAQLPFEISRVNAGLWNVESLLDMLGGIERHTSRHCTSAEIMNGIKGAMAKASHDELYTAIQESWRKVRQLHRRRHLSDDFFEPIRRIVEDIRRNGYAVRINYAPQDMDLGNTFVLVQNATKGAGLYIGLRDTIYSPRWDNLLQGGESLRSQLHFERTGPRNCRSIPPGTPYGATGDMDMLVIEGYPRDTAFVYDWGRMSFARLMKRAKERNEDVKATDVLTHDELKQMKFFVPGKNAPGVIERRTTTFEMTRVAFGQDDSHRFTVEMGDRAAYVVCLSGWITVATHSNALRLERYNAAVIPPLAGDAPNVLSISASGLPSTALVVRPL